MAFIKYRPGTVASKNNYIVEPPNGKVVVPDDAPTEYLRAEDVHRVSPYGDGAIIRYSNTERPANAIALATTPAKVAAAVADALARGYQGDFKPCECPMPEAEAEETETTPKPPAENQPDSESVDGQ